MSVTVTHIARRNHGHEAQADHQLLHSAVRVKCFQLTCSTAQLFAHRSWVDKKPFGRPSDARSAPPRRGGAMATDNLFRPQASGITGDHRSEGIRRSSPAFLLPSSQFRPPPPWCHGGWDVKFRGQASQTLPNGEVSSPHCNDTPFGTPIASPNSHSSQGALVSRVPIARVGPNGNSVAIAPPLMHSPSSIAPRA